MRALRAKIAVGIGLPANEAECSRIRCGKGDQRTEMYRKHPVLAIALQPPPTSLPTTRAIDAPHADTR